MLGGRRGRRQQQANEIDRLIVDGGEIDRALEPGQ